MGSVGKSKDGDITYQKLDKDSLKELYSWDNAETSWFDDHGNMWEWRDGLTDDEERVIKDYTGLDYDDINTSQYTKAWEDMSFYEKQSIANLHNALSKFELKDGIIVNRACDFQIFGAGEHESMTISDVRNYLKPTDGYLQNDGFMSFSTKANGVPVEGHGLIIQLKIPPTTGAGAYIEPVSYHQQEKEFLLNNNAILKFDYNSMYQDSKGIHITAEYVGYNDAQTISPTYNGKLKR